MKTKVCFKCKIEKEASREYFTRLTTNPDGLLHMCKICYRQDKKRRRQANIKVYKEASKRFRLNNPEKIEEYNKKSKEKRKIRAHNYNQKPENKDRANKLRRARGPAKQYARRKYRYHSDPEYRKKLLQYSYKTKRNRLKTDSGYKLKEILRSRIVSFIKHNKRCVKGSITQLLGCTREELKQFIENKFQPGMTWDNYGYGKNKWVLDHIIPLALFNFDSEHERQKAGHYTNLQPLWFEDNRIKRDKINHSTIPLATLSQTLPLLIK